MNLEQDKFSSEVIDSICMSIIEDYDKGGELSSYHHSAMVEILFDKRQKAIEFLGDFGIEYDTLDEEVCHRGKDTTVSEWVEHISHLFESPLIKAIVSLPVDSSEVLPKTTELSKYIKENLENYS